MRSYVAVTGTFFSIVAVTHIVRAFVEDGLVLDAWFIAATIIAFGLAAWSIALLLKQPKPQA